METINQPADPDHPTPGDNDPRSHFARAVAIGGSVVGKIRPEQLHLPTPCTDMDVSSLLEHVTMVLLRVAALGRGEDGFARPPVVGDVAADGWAETWANAAHEVQEAWTDPVTLTRSVKLPWADTDGAGALRSYVSELTVHTWDLAAASGQTPPWDDEVVEVALEAIRQALPAEGRAEAFAEVRRTLPPEQAAAMTDPFAEAVDVAPDVPTIDRLVAWTGRYP